MLTPLAPTRAPLAPLRSFPDDPVVTLAGHSGEQSQQEVVKSALNRFIKESENISLSDEENDLFD